MNIKGIVVLVITILGFDILFMLLNTRYDLKNRFIFKIIPENWKGKWIIKWVFIFILLLILATIQVHFKLSDLLGYIIAGIIISLCDFAFKKSGITREIK